MPLNLYGSTANVFGAFVIGMIGAFGYLKALHFGFLASEQVAKEIRTSKDGWRHTMQFVAVGGAIAAVFQLAQLNNFAAVQAFVLGATWPTVIGQHIGGKDANKVNDAIQTELTSSHPSDGKSLEANNPEVQIQAAEKVVALPSSQGAGGSEG